MSFIQSFAKRVLAFLAERDAYWKWDNHAHVALLTSGKVSDVFINCTPIFSCPAFQAEVGRALYQYGYGLPAPHGVPLDEFCRTGNVWVIGSAMGAIGLAQSVTDAVNGLDYPHVRAGFTEPQADKTMLLKRFDLGKEPKVLLVEDVFTTGGTTLRTMDALLKAHVDVRFFPYALSVINRSQQGGPLKMGPWTVQMHGLCDIDAGVWDTMDDVPANMKACVPVRPKADWKLLTTEKLSG